MDLQVRNTFSVGMRPFGEAQSKAMRAYAQSDNIIPLWRSVISNMVSECSCRTKGRGLQ